jgi:serine/threonine protein phosphatase PrpC
MKIESAAFTHVGRRENNEDAFCDAPDLGLFAVADGMGGYEGGEVASRLAVDAVSQFFDRNRRDRDATWPFALDARLSFGENLVSVAVRVANQAVCARRTGRLASMGSTLAALHLQGREAVVGHVGDSRVYRLRAGELRALTRDHSLYAEMEAAGLLGAGETRGDFPLAHVVTRALGVPGAAGPDLRTEALLAGDVYLLCTDGLSEAVPAARVAAALRTLAPAAAARALVAESYERGTRDNITALVVRVCGV